MEGNIGGCFLNHHVLCPIPLPLPSPKDADAAYQCVCDFVEPSCVIVKHTNPCGVATRTDLLEAYRLAVSGGGELSRGGIKRANAWIAMHGLN